MVMCRGTSRERKDDEITCLSWWKNISMMMGFAEYAHGKIIRYHLKGQSFFCEI